MSRFSPTPRRKCRPASTRPVRAARSSPSTIPSKNCCPFQFDMNSLPFDCLEIWNGPMRESNLRAVGLWQSMLVAGKKVPICGGSDYHRDHLFIIPRRTHHLRPCHVGQPGGYPFRIETGACLHDFCPQWPHPGDDRRRCHPGRQRAVFQRSRRFKLQPVVCWPGMSSRWSLRAATSPPESRNGRRTARDHTPWKPPDLPGSRSCAVSCPACPCCRH